MGDKHTNRIRVDGPNSAPIVQSGRNSGTISAAQRNVPERVDELTALLHRLRTEVAAAKVDKREVLEDNLDDLAVDVRKAGHPDTAGEVVPEVARSRWAKVTGLLGGLSQFADLVTEISDHVRQLFG